MDLKQAVIDAEPFLPAGVKKARWVVDNLGGDITLEVVLMDGEKYKRTLTERDQRTFSQLAEAQGCWRRAEGEWEEMHFDEARDQRARAFMLILPDLSLPA